MVVIAILHWSLCTCFLPTMIQGVSLVVPSKFIDSVTETYIFTTQEIELEFYHHELC
jgi:cytochrome b subunit of formate dehydrogenase